MIFSLNWAKDYININLAPSDFAYSLTMAGFEVEKIKDDFSYLNDFITAKILKIYPHPNADKLQLCDVDTGSEVLKVVCGAPNIEAGQIVPFAKIGTTMPNGLTLKKVKIRGEESNGMLCSASELEIAEDKKGIMILDESLALGLSLKEALKLENISLEIDITPNRPDCLSILGLAREAAAICNSDFKYPKIDYSAEKSNLTDEFSVEIKDKDLCPRYAALFVKDVKVGQSPFWLKEKLKSAGLNPVNNIVDISNFVMMEMGQPLHTFDADLISDKKIIVKRAGDNAAKFKTLDGKKRELDKDVLMICDNKKDIGIAGIMGGENSEISDKTKNIIIESAYFLPASIRKSSKKLTLGSDASYRFERGIDPTMQLDAMFRAANLICQIAKGKCATSYIDENYIQYKDIKIDLDIEKTNRILSLSLSKDEIKSKLESVAFKTEDIGKNKINVSCPSFRVDLSCEEDLFEEVARLNGYDNIPVKYPLIPMNVVMSNKSITVEKNMKDILLGLGFSELINYSFISENFCDLLNIPKEDKRRNLIKIKNPLSTEQKVMRSTLVFSLLQTVKKNIHNYEKNLKFFEYGKVFFNLANNKTHEEGHIAVIQTGLVSKETFFIESQDRKCDFFDIKGDLENFFEALKIDNFQVKKLEDKFCIYTKTNSTGKILIDDEEVGIIGEIDDKILENFDIKEPCFIFEINCAKLTKFIKDKREYKEPSLFPYTDRDLTMVCSDEIEAVDIISQIYNLDNKLIKKAFVFDVYQGESIAKGSKSISLRIRYQDDNSTLKVDFINKLHAQISEKIIKIFDGKFV